MPWRVFWSQNRKSTFAEYALISDVGRRLFPEFFGGNRRVTDRENSHEMRNPAHEMRQSSRPKPAGSRFSLTPLFAGSRRAKLALITNGLKD
jgi:hypothetical protein